MGEISIGDIMMATEKLKIIRFEVDADLHTAFKLECVANGVSMKDQIIQMMRDYSKDKKG